MAMSDADATAAEIEKAILLSTAQEHNQKQKASYKPCSPSSLPVIQPDNIPPVVQELVFNGYELERVMRAYDLVGDNFDAILEVVGLLREKG